jgi:hypothetical protein
MAVSPGGPPPASRPADRRPARRGAKADVRRVGSAVGDDLAAGLTEVAPDGAVVRLTVAVSVGEELAICLVRPDGRLTARLTATVRWCRPIGGGLYAAGLRFDRGLRSTELAGLV